MRWSRWKNAIGCGMVPRTVCMAVAERPLSRGASTARSSSLLCGSSRPGDGSDSLGLFIATAPTSVASRRLHA